MARAMPATFGYDLQPATPQFPAHRLLRMLGRHPLGGQLTMVNDQALPITLSFTEQRGKQ